MRALKEKIIAANKAYRLGRPVMSDQAFDDLCEAYEKTVSSDEYKAFRDSLHEETGKVRHPYVMGSLDKLKAEEPEKVIEFIRSLGVEFVSVSAKVDGISCRVHYGYDGVFESATTRGDGTYGIDVTEKVRHIVPANISWKNPVDIRGELVITYKEFKGYFEPHGFKNPRNACAGIMNAKELDTESCGHIAFVPYEIMGGEISKIKQFTTLVYMGFRPAWNEVVSADEPDFVAKLCETASQNFDYPTDGLVICPCEYMQELDEYRPKRQKAFKLNQESGWTEILDVEWGNPSKDGRMTPVAVLEGVEIAGSTIAHVTLNNLDWMGVNEVRIGSHVLICKSGDVIPKIIKVDNEGHKTTEIVPPEFCPVCGAKLTTRDDVDICCPNEDCDSRKYEQVLTFITNLGIQHVSRATLEDWKLTSVEKLLNFNPDSKYKLQVRFARDLKDKMYNASEDNLFKALSFAGLAEKTLSKIIDFYGYRELEAGGWTGPFIAFPEGVGEKTMEAFGKDAKRNFSIVHSIIASSRWTGKLFTKDASAAVESKGESVCFTGALNTMSRSEAQAKAKAAGYEVKSGVSKGLTYLVTNDPSSGSSKNKKAHELGVTIIDEEAFLKML